MLLKIPTSKENSLVPPPQHLNRTPDPTFRSGSQ